VGWDARDFALPGSIRDAVVGTLEAFSEQARSVADLAAVIGTRATYPLLSSISGLGEGELLSALEELCSHGILTERTEGSTVVHDFRHPLVRETLYREFGLQRSRVLHGAVAEAMEAYWGDRALDHADELAYHFARADTGHLTDKAVTYLAAAGRAALERHADREAADYLQAALDRAEGPGGYPVGEGKLAPLVADLARAHRRLGEYEAAAALWERALPWCEPGSEEHAAILRRLAQVDFWCGRAQKALESLDAALRSAESTGAEAQQVQIRLIRSHCFQELGRGADAQAEVAAALPVAESIGDADLLSRVHRSLALLHAWIGPPQAAELHAAKAIALARPAGDRSVEFWAHWALAVLWGMAGETSKMVAETAAATALANELRSPVLRLWTEELSIELAYGSGDWDAGIALGEQAIALARSLNQRRLLPRLLTLTSLFYLGRGDLDRVRALLDEAYDVSGLLEDGRRDVHMMVPTLIGTAHYQVALGEYDKAIETARRGLDIAEGTGYTPWAVHRLLPILAEACLWAGEIDEAERVGRTLRGHATANNHKLGLAWADACDAMVRWKRGDARGGALAMREAAEALEAIPMIPYAARVRRQLAGRLAEIGDVEGSLAELRRVHDVFAQIGAELELEKARIQFREVGHRPPPRGVGEGVAGLTAREVEIARRVARRRSNKAIAKELGISPRTVSTHLSNIFQKLDLTSRAELGDLIREQGLME
jgi:DNA-binding CsgD family transcriptional regulator/tetratricopeptide (TPR) repeat protein